MEEKKKQNLTPQQALMKLKQYCAYQERSHSEVRQKLWDLGVSPKQHDEIISQLIQEDYLNEERFAIQYAGGKFRMKGWGRNRIIAGLKQKQVSAFCIKKAMRAIDEDEYMATAVKTAARKYETLSGTQALRQKKLTDFMMQKGFELNVIRNAYQQVVSGQ